jgi:hypothetical protein
LSRGGNEGEDAANDAVTIVREGAWPWNHRLKFPGGNGGGISVFHYDVAEGICMEVAPPREAPVISVLFSVFDM